MAKLNLDMSGRGGLAPRFFGDINRTVATPELRYLGKANQFAYGIYNPFRRFGYLSPSNDTFTSVTNYVPTTLTTTLNNSNTWSYIGVALNPNTTTRPTVLGTPTADVVAASGGSLTISTTVASGNHRVLTVLAFGNTSAPSSATFNSVPMTLVSSGSSGFYYAIFQLVNPDVTTANVVITWGVNSTYRMAACVVTQETNQITPSNVYGANTGSSTSATLSLTPTVNDCLIIGAITSGDTATPTHTQASTQTQLVTDIDTLRMSSSSRQTINTSIFGASIYDDIENDHYWAERGVNIMKGDGLDDLTLESVLTLPTSNVLTDLDIYQINNVRKLFYVYKNTGTNALDIGIASLPFSSSNNNWLTSTVAGAFSNTTLTNPFIRKSDNGFAYIFQDNVVHKIDGTVDGGTNGTVTANVLTFPNFFQITDAVDYRSKVIMSIVHRTSDLSNNETSNFNSACGVYVWDRQSTQLSMADYIPLNGVKEIRRVYISPKGRLRMICVSSNRLVQIREYNNSTFEIIQELPTGSYPKYHDSLTVVHTMTFWLGADGYFYGHGSPTDVEEEGLFITGNPTGDGAILFGGSNSFSSSTGFRSDFEAFYISRSLTSFVKWFYNAGNNVGGNNQTANTGNVYTMVRFLPKLSTVNFIRIFGAPCSGTDSNTIATVKIYFNQSSTAWASKTITKEQWSRGYVDIPVSKPYVNAVQLEVEFAANAISSDDFAPAYAEIDYSPTETNK